MRGRLPRKGTIDGDGAVQSFNVGFRPVMVIVINVEDGDVVHLHIDGMTDGTSVDIGAAAAGNANNAITLTSLGFQVGTDISESGKTYHYVAF